MSEATAPACSVIADSRLRADLRRMTALRIEDAIRSCTPSSPMEQLLTSLCEATMWMMKEWPNELEEIFIHLLAEQWPPYPHAQNAPSHTVSYPMMQLNAQAPPDVKSMTKPKSQMRLQGSETPVKEVIMAKPSSYTCDNSGTTPFFPFLNSANSLSAAAAAMSASETATCSTGTNHDQRRGQPEFMDSYGGGMSDDGCDATVAQVNNDEVMRQLLLYSYGNPEDDVFKTNLKDDLKEEEMTEFDAEEETRKEKGKRPKRDIDNKKLAKTTPEGSTPITIVQNKPLKNLDEGGKLKRKKKRRAFEFYWEERRADYAKSHAHLGHNERRAIAQAAWRGVTEREKWQAMADEYNERMHEEKYRDKPKPPVTANAFFFKEHHKVLRAENPGMRGCDVLAEIGRMWEKTDDKQRYIEMQNEDRKRYEQELLTYKVKGLVDGSSTHI